MTGFDHPEQMPRTLGAVTVALTAAAGALDVVTYFAFDQVFASTMTGNLVLLGLGIGQGDPTKIVDNICAIIGYCSGLAVGAMLCSLAMRRLPWRNAVGIALTVELAILVMVGIGWYGFDEPGNGTFRAVVLVLGSGLAMGVQGAAGRYIGPGGTPTNFLSGTVTNWVAGAFELHKPKWDGNSALRILVVVVAAVANALVQRHFPDWSYVMPVALVVLAVALMAVVARANHGGLFEGEPQLAPDPREEVPAAGEDEDDELPAGPAPVGHVHGRVLGAEGDPRPAVLTLVSGGGEQVGRTHTATDGTYRLDPPESGDFMLICSPHRMGGRASRPRAVLIAVDGHPVAHDLVLGAAEGEPAPASR